MTAPCPSCGGDRHPALDKAGLPLHPNCEIPPRPTLVPGPPDACDAAACKPRDPVIRYEGQGDYCGRHARMMISRSQWPQYQVPEPEAG